VRVDSGARRRRLREPGVDPNHVLDVLVGLGVEVGRSPNGTVEPSLPTDG
jgi:hypothetical protein